MGLRYITSGQIPMITADPMAAMGAITPEQVTEARTFFPLEKFFIFGHARSGTTMLVRLVRVHPDVHCNYQAHFFTRPPLLQSLVADKPVREWLSRNSNRWNRGTDLSPVVLRAAADFILEREARRVGKSIVGDKSPNNLLNGAAVENMHRIYPDAKLIFIVRDGRDAALSHRFQAFIDLTEQLSKEDARIRADFIRDPQPFLNGDRSLFTEKGLKFEAETWERNVRETDVLGRKLYGDQFLTLRYEDLLSKTWDEMIRLWDFLGATTSLTGLEKDLTAELSRNPDAEYQQQKAGEIAESLTKGKRGTWKDFFCDRDKLTFQDIAGGMLDKWGYE